MAIVCKCGYECRLPGEVEALGQYGCAKTVTRKSGPFSSFELVQCTQEDILRQSNPVLPRDDQGAAFKDAYLQKYNKPKEDGSKQEK